MGSKPKPVLKVSKILTLTTTKSWILYVVALSLALTGLILWGNKPKDLIILVLFEIPSLIVLILLTYKDSKVLNKLSYLAFVFAVFLIGAIAFTFQDKSLNEEKLFYFINVATMLLVLVQSSILLKKTGALRILALIVIFLTIISCSGFLISPPYFYSNFIMSRIYFVINFAYAIFLIFRSSKISRIFGILGILATAGLLVLSVFLFNKSKTHVPQKEKVQVLTYANDETINMINGFNSGNKQQFSKNFSSSLKASGFANLDDFMKQLGTLTITSGPEVFYMENQYIIEYITKSNKVTNDIIFDVKYSTDESDHAVQGFSITIEPIKGAENEKK